MLSVSDVGFEVYGLGFGASGSGLRFGVQGKVCRALHFGVWVWVSACGLRIPGSAFRISHIRFRVPSCAVHVVDELFYYKTSMTTY